MHAAGCGLWEKVWAAILECNVMDAAPYIGRFAPSPSGPLHAGSLLAALGSWLMARRAGGLWRVRIEDLDPPREVRGAAAGQLRTLAAFGLQPDGAVWYQSTRGEAYAQALRRLLEAGIAYPCHCSRTALAANGGIHHACVHGRRRDPSLRMHVPEGSVVVFDDEVCGRIEQDLRREVGDFVLRRADGLWAYQLAVVVDDAAQGITHVVRGADLLDSTPRQILLQRALGLPTPAYAHLPLVLDGQGRKLSKSLVACPVDAADPLPSLRQAWAWLGQPPAAVADAGSVDAFLRQALVAFQPSAIPCVRAAVHNNSGPAQP